MVNDVMPKRTAFIAWCKSRSLDTDVDKDAWGALIFKHPHIQSMWEGWFNAPTAQSRHTAPVERKSYKRSLESLGALLPVETMWGAQIYPDLMEYILDSYDASKAVDHHAVMADCAAMDTDQAREYLVSFMEQNFTDTTFHRYIRGQQTGTNLAGDFAWQMATALRRIAKPARELTDADIDLHLAAILRASGSSLKNYSNAMMLENMRTEVAKAMRHLAGDTVKGL